MPRDRPASAGQDSTLEGEFPSDFGGGGGPSVKPKPIATPYDKYGKTGYNEGKADGNSYQLAYANVSPILRIKDTPIGGSKSGVYRWNTAYHWGYTIGQAAVFNQTLTQNGNLQQTTQTTFAGYNLMGLKVSVMASPAGTGTIAPGGLQVKAGISNLTATHFAEYSLPTLGLFNKTAITSAESAWISAHFLPAPAYPLTLMGSNAAPRQFAAIPNSNTTFNLTLSFTANGATDVVIDRGRVNAYGFGSFSAYASGRTLTTGL